MNSKPCTTQPTLNLPYLFVTWKLSTVFSKNKRTLKVTRKIANLYFESYAQASLFYSKLSKRVLHT